MKYLSLTDTGYRYLLEHSAGEADILRRLREETADDPKAMMQISADQGQFMALLARLLGVERYLEVGVFTGYSSLVMALALPDSGRITACDVSEEWTSTAQRYWAEAGVSEKIDLRLAPAAETLGELIAGGAGATYDLAFIDADKENYESYFNQCLELVRPGGLIMVDNVLWGGKAADPSVSDEDTEAIRAFNRKRLEDGRVEICILPVGDGLTLARKKS